MVLEVPLVAVGFAAAVTHELLAGVDHLVGFETVALAEAAAAHVTDIRLLARVDAAMPNQVGTMIEAFVTQVAGIWLLTRVFSLKRRG